MIFMVEYCEVLRQTNTIVFLLAIRTTHLKTIYHAIRLLMQ